MKPTKASETTTMFVRVCNEITRSFGGRAQGLATVAKGKAGRKPTIENLKALLRQLDSVAEMAEFRANNFRVMSLTGKDEFEKSKYIPELLVIQATHEITDRGRLLESTLRLLTTSVMPEIETIRNEHPHLIGHLHSALSAHRMFLVHQLNQPDDNHAAATSATTIASTSNSHAGRNHQNHTQQTGSNGGHRKRTAEAADMHSQVAAKRPRLHQPPQAQQQQQQPQPTPQPQQSPQPPQPQQPQQQVQAQPTQQNVAQQSATQEQEQVAAASTFGPGELQVTPAVETDSMSSDSSDDDDDDDDDDGQLIQPIG